MFAKKLVTQSMIDAVNQVIGQTTEEVQQQQLLDEKELRVNETKNALEYAQKQSSVKDKQMCDELDNILDEYNKKNNNR